MPRYEPVAISVISGLVVQHDAISDSVVATVRALERRWPGKTKLFTYRCDTSNLPAVTVDGLSSLLKHRHFVESDLLIYHFGIHYPLFDAVVTKTGKARQVVRFHNVTPKSLVSSVQHETIDRSLRQLQNLSFVDRVWCDSPFNRDDLLAYGIAPEKLEVFDLPVAVLPTHVTAESKTSEFPRLLFVGRFVSSKGVSELLQAVALCHRRTRIKMQLTLLGSTQFSDANYVNGLYSLRSQLGLDEVVSFAGNASEQEKWEAFQRAHVLVIPSYHEGFCVPIVEALSAGCAVIGFEAGNIPFVAGGLADLVPPGDILRLSEAIERFVERWYEANGCYDHVQIRCGNQDVAGRDFLLSARRHAMQFDVRSFPDRLNAAMDRLHYVEPQTH